MLAEKCKKKLERKKVEHMTVYRMTSTALCVHSYKSTRKHKLMGYRKGWCQQAKNPVQLYSKSVRSSLVACTILIKFSRIFQPSQVGLARNGHLYGPLLHKVRTAWPQAKYFPMPPSYSVNKYLIFLQGIEGGRGNTKKVAQQFYNKEHKVCVALPFPVLSSRLLV